MDTHCHLKSQQHGVVLIISLLILLVLTLIGVSSLDGSIMEEKMASNSQTAAATFQQADSAIQTAVNLARNNPPGAVASAIAGVAPVDRSTGGITSASQLYNPAANAVKTPLYNSSAGIFIARPLQIIGTANVGAIRNRNVQGYRVFPMMVAP